MSKIHPPLCPLLSRSVTFPRLSDPNGVEPGVDREDYLVAIDCQQEGCAWWNHNEEMCSIHLLGCAELDKIRFEVKP